LTFNNSVGQCEYATYPDDSLGDGSVLVDNPTPAFYFNGAIIDNSPATSASGTSPICSGSSSTLTETRGSLGLNGN